jgi:hypothetical protein
MDLVTVTCNRDLTAMILQAESIQKFLNPCTHWVIVNENIPNLDKWHKALSPFYINHKLKLLPRLYDAPEDYSDIDAKWGWRMQQIQKLYVATILEDDYLILDSRNLFIKNTDLEEFREIQGSGIIQRLDDSKFNNPRHQAYLEKYCSKLGIDKPKFALCEFTPFKIDLDTIKNFKDLYNVHEYLISEPYIHTNLESSSEFILYSMLIPNISTNFKEEIKWETIHNFPVKEDNILYAKTFLRITKAINNENIKVLKFDRSLIDNLKQCDLDILNNILQELRFSFRFYQTHEKNR